VIPKLRSFKNKKFFWQWDNWVDEDWISLVPVFFEKYFYFVLFGNPGVSTQESATTTTTQCSASLFFSLLLYYILFCFSLLFFLALTSEYGHGTDSCHSSPLCVPVFVWKILSSSFLSPPLVTSPFSKLRLLINEWTGEYYTIHNSKGKRIKKENPTMGLLPTHKNIILIPRLNPRDKVDIFNLLSSHYLLLLLSDVSCRQLSSQLSLK